MASTRLDEVQGLLERLAASEAALEASELHYRTLYEVSRDCVFIMKSGRFVSVNEAALRAFRTSREALLGMTPFDLSPEQQPDGQCSAEVGARHIEAALRGELVETSWRHRRPDGSFFDAEITLGAFELDGEPHVYGILRDISDRLEAQTRLHYQASLIDNLNDAVISTDLEFCIVSWNRAAAQLYGWSSEEVMGRRMAEVVPTAYPHDDGAEVREQFLREGRWEGEVVQRCRDGEEVNVFASVAAIRNEAGEPVGAVAVNRDITGRKQLERQLLQAQKMEAVGQLAGGIAHDFNNLLTIIRYYSDVAAEDLVGGDPLRADLEEIQTATERAAELTRMLLTFSRRSVVKRKRLDLCAAVERFAKMARRVLGETIELRVSVPDQPMWVTFDRTQLDQVFMNLVTNAKDALPTGGTLSFAIGSVELGKAEARARPDLEPGPHVQLVVRDNGAGMPEPIQARIFEPFFTTKETGKGTGLGLATVLGIVRQNEGHVAVESEPGAGTAFTFYFPRALEGLRDAAASVSPAAAGGSEIILVVEDEAAILEVVAKMLTKRGYTVIRASHPGEALLVHELHEGEIHLLLTDVVLPGIRGDDLARRLTARSPSMKVVFMTGDRREHLALGDDRVVLKPFAASDLLGTIRETLDA